MSPLLEVMIEQLVPALLKTDTVLYPKGEESNCAGERHSYWELCFLSQGASVFYLEGERLELKQNTLVLLPPGTPHCEAWEESGFYRLLWLGLWADYFTVFISERYQIREGIRVPGAAAHLSLLEQALVELKRKDFCYQEVVTSYLTLFFVAVLRSFEVDSPHVPSWKAQVVEEVQQYLATNLTAQVTLAEISNQVGLSPNYLCSLFREQTGKTIFEHLGDLRLKKAQFLLRKTELPIYSIAEQVGYSNQFAFSKFFRKAMGISPTSYRERKEEEH